MGLVPFIVLFPELGEHETGTATVFGTPPDSDVPHLPPDEYGFVEYYCTERGCDCRRVMINVLARHARQHVATISHAFDEPVDDDLVPEQTFLDPLNRQSPLAETLLDFLKEVVLVDKEYCQRLMRHYRMFKNVVEDPTHPNHRLLHHPQFDAPGSRRQSISPLPPRAGKRKKWR